MDSKTGVYICSGCDIDQAMDVEEVNACVHVSSAEYTRGMARRVETQIRAD